MSTNLKLLLLRALTAAVALGCLKVGFTLWWANSDPPAVSDPDNSASIDYSTFIDHDLGDKLYYTLLYAALLTTGQVSQARNAVWISVITAHVLV